MSNNILVITSNPEKDSMTDAVGAAFAAGAVERGASADVLDLYDEGFNPVYSAADRAHYLGHAPMPEDVLLIQRRLAQADVSPWCSRSTGIRCRRWSRDCSTA